MQKHHQRVVKVDFKTDDIRPRPTEREQGYIGGMDPYDMTPFSQTVDITFIRTYATYLVCTSYYYY